MLHSTLQINPNLMNMTFTKILPLLTISEAEPKNKIRVLIKTTINIDTCNARWFGIFRESIEMSQQDQFLLILDIDETLLLAAERPLQRKPDCAIGPYSVYLRPFLKEFLEQVQLHFQIAVWSASSSDYVETIVNTIFLNEIQLEFAWSRTRCVPRFNPERHEHYFVKDLKKTNDWVTISIEF